MKKVKLILGLLLLISTTACSIKDTGESTSTKDTNEPALTIDALVDKFDTYAAEIDKQLAGTVFKQLIIKREKANCLLLNEENHWCQITIENTFDDNGVLSKSDWYVTINFNIFNDNVF